MMYESILDAIGHTPLVLLQRMTQGLQARVAVKVESANPGGSIKDRVAWAMIQDAERKGLLAPGGTIIEATAGNTGVGLAMVAAVRGYRCICVLPDKMSQEKIALLKAYGAEVVITPTNVPPDSPESYNGVADRLAREIPGAWRPNQFGNLSNPEIHYLTTAPEIWEQTKGKITVFVAGVGTGGTITGVAKYLKERNPNIRVVGADPEGSVLSGGTPKPWKVEGIGEDFVPKTFSSQYVDEWERISDAESFHVARMLARREGLLLGGSSGTNVAAALRYARRLGPEHLVVTIGCDTGRNYLSKFFNDDWLVENQLTYRQTQRHSVADLLQRRGPRQLAIIQPDATADEAIHLMERLGVSQLPVLENGRAIGSIQEITLARLLHDGRDPRQVIIRDVMARPLPLVDIHTDLDEVYRLLLAGYSGVLATDRDNVLDIITRIDLIQYWDETRTHSKAEPSEGPPSSPGSG
jgi:cystathionine beta-synthase